MNIDYNLISQCLRSPINYNNISYLREEDIPIDCSVDNKLYIRSVIEKFKINTFRPNSNNFHNQSIPHQSINLSNDINMDNLSSMQQPIVMTMTNQIACDVKNCINSPKSVCEICSNPICLIHQNIKKDYHYAYTQYSSSLTIDKQGLCPDCYFASNLKIGITTKNPPCWCCVNSASKLTICIIFTFLICIAIILCTIYIQSENVYLGFSYIFVEIIMPTTGGLCLICGTLNLYFNYIIKIRNKEIDKKDLYIKMMKMSNGYHHGVFDENKMIRSCCLGSVHL